jgi:hypothetical protein
MKMLIQEACQGPVRDAFKASAGALAELRAEELRPVVLRDFQVGVGAGALCEVVAGALWVGGWVDGGMGFGQRALPARLREFLLDRGGRLPDCLAVCATQPNHRPRAHRCPARLPHGV